MSLCSSEITANMHDSLLCESSVGMLAKELHPIGLPWAAQYAKDLVLHCVRGYDRQEVV